MKEKDRKHYKSIVLKCSGSLFNILINVIAQFSSIAVLKRYDYNHTLSVIYLSMATSVMKLEHITSGGGDTTVMKAD